MLEDEFRPKKVPAIQTKLLILNRDDAIDMLNECRQRGIRVFGVDVFHIHGVKIQPDVGLSIDASDLSAESAWHQCMSKLEQLESPELGFELTVSEVEGRHY